MASTLAYIVFFAIVVLIVNYSLFKRYENVYIQKLIFFHKKIDMSNLKTFRLNQSFEASLEFNNYPIPKVRDELLGNHDYYVTVHKYIARKDITRKVNIALVSIAVFSVISGVLT